MKRKWKLFFIMAACIALLIPIVFYRPPDKYLIEVFAALERPFLKDLAFNVLQARTSIQKSINIMHLPYWFKESNLPIYRINIDPKDIQLMNDYLPKNVYADNLVSENKIFVTAIFESGDYYNENVEVRYRGALNSHWSHAKRSLLVKFPGDALFDTMKSIDLIVPRDRAYLIELINNSRLKRHGLVTPNMFFVWVKINNKDAGVYLAKERFSKSWLEKNAIPDDGEVFSQTVEASQEIPSLNSGSSAYNTWRRDIYETNNSFEELETLFSLVQNPDDKIFEKNIGNIIDLEKWYKAIVVNLLVGGAHSLEVNLNLLVNSATGKLEPLLEDMHIYEPDYRDAETTYKIFDPITRRILSNPAFYEEYRNILKEMSSTENMKRDLEFYDSLYSALIPEFYKDQTKYRSDLQVNSTIKKMRTWIIENYEIARTLVNIEETPILGAGTEIATEDKFIYSMPSSYKYFYDISRPVNEFVKAHPEFRIEGENLIFASGQHTFEKTIIIPQHTKLIINPGTKIYLNEDVSLVSYSPIIAVGKKQSPILIARAQQNKNWGVVAVANTEEKSEFSYVTMVGGSSSERINGVKFTGMLSAYNSPLYVSNSQFYKDSDDDMINAKYSIGEIKNSQFFDAAGDAIDLDMTENFLVQKNTFSNIGNEELGGDAIDLSFSNNAFVSKNKISECSDKGISVGEKSTTQISENIINGCAIGIAVKDKSRATITDNIFSENLIGVALYQKKSIFGGGEAALGNNIFENNETKIDVSNNSSVVSLDKK